MDQITEATQANIAQINKPESSSAGNSMLNAGIAGLMNAKVILIVVLLLLVVWWFWFRQPFTTHPVVLNPQSTYVMKN